MGGVFSQHVGSGDDGPRVSDGDQRRRSLHQRGLVRPSALVRLSSVCWARLGAEGAWSQARAAGHTRQVLPRGGPAGANARPGRLQHCSHRLEASGRPAASALRWQRWWCGAALRRRAGVVAGAVRRLPADHAARRRDELWAGAAELQPGSEGLAGRSGERRAGTEQQQQGSVVSLCCESSDDRAPT